MDTLYAGRLIRTFSGNYVDVFNPDPATITIEDIAHHLSNQCRFSGALPEFYSVAQHSYLTSYLVEQEHKLAALLHDAAEAYLVDIPSPIKREIRDYAALEDGLMEVIANKFGFAYPLHPSVKAADKEMLEMEWNGIMLGNFHAWRWPCQWYNPGTAKRQFILEFKKLVQ